MVVRDCSVDMPFMLDKEVGTMTSMLEQAGYHAVVATDSGKTIRSGNASLKADIRLSRARIDRYADMIIPCRAASDAATAIRTPDSANSVVKRAFAAGIPIAAQNSAVDDLGKSGIIRGKQYAIDAALVTVVSDGICKVIGVVQDGEITTSGACPYMARETGKPDRTRKLTQRIIGSMSRSE